MYPEKTKDQILRHHDIGRTVKELSAVYCISKSCIYNWIKDNRSIKSYNDAAVITHREYYDLEREAKCLREEVEIFHNARCSIISPLDEKLSEMTRLQKAYGYSVHALCRALEVRRSAFYHYTLRKPEQTVFEKEAEMLKPIIKEIFMKSKERFGSRMIRVKLLELGYTASQVRIAALMKEMGLVCNAERKTLPEYRRTYAYSGHGFAVNKLKRQFSQPSPNLVWVSDLTYLRAKDGVHYLCVILDLYSRKVIAHKLADSKCASIVMDCFQKAYAERQPNSGLMFHSDQGAEYYSGDLKQLLTNCGTVHSFSNVGTPYDNAVAESFFGSLKREQMYQHVYENAEELAAAVDEYTDFYNNERPHQRLGMLTPAQAEDAYFFSKKLQ